MIALILGIAGAGCCAAVSPLALVLSVWSKRRIMAASGARRGRWAAQAGFVLGIVGTVLLALWAAIMAGFVLTGSYRTPA